MADHGKRSRSRGKENSKVLIVVIPIVALILLCGAVFLFLRNARGSKLSDKSCVYYANSKVTIPKDSKLRFDEAERKTYVETVNGDRTEIALPIYSENLSCITTPVSMVYYDPRANEKGRLTYFTRIRKDEHGEITAEYDGRKKMLPQGFAFDGKDLYVFLEPMTLSLNGYTVELPAMSYVEALYNQNVTVFNSETKEFIIESPTTSVTAEASAGDYKISLLSDSMQTRSGKKLLFSSPDLLDPVV